MTTRTDTPAPATQDVAERYLATLDGHAYRSLILRAAAGPTAYADQVRLELELGEGPLGVMALEIHAGRGASRLIEGLHRGDLVPMLAAMRDLVLKAVEAGVLPADPAELEPDWLRRLAPEAGEPHKPRDLSAFLDD